MYNNSISSVCVCTMRMLHLAICHDDRNEAMRTEAGDFLNKGNGKF